MPGSSVFRRDLIEISSTTTDTSIAGTVLTAVPIMGFDSRLGTLVFAYSKADMEAYIRDLYGRPAEQPD